MSKQDYFVDVNLEQLKSIQELICTEYKYKILEDCKELLVKDTISVTKTRVEELLQEATDTQRIKIRKILQLSLVEDMKADRWYKSTNSDFKFKFNGLFDKNYSTTYGVGSLGMWDNDLRVSKAKADKGLYEKMMPSEIQGMLIEEAKNRYKLPQAIFFLDYPNETDLLSGFNLSYDAYTDTLYSSSTGKHILYKDGKWAKSTSTRTMDIGEAQEALSELMGVRVLISY